MKNLKQIIIVFFVAGFLVTFFYLDLGQYLSLHHIKEQQSKFFEFYRKNNLLAISAYMVVYIKIRNPLVLNFY